MNFHFQIPFTPIRSDMIRLDSPSGRTVSFVPRNLETSTVLMSTSQANGERHCVALSTGKRVAGCKSSRIVGEATSFQRARRRGSGVKDTASDMRKQFRRRFLRCFPATLSLDTALISTYYARVSSFFLTSPRSC